MHECRNDSTLFTVPCLLRIRPKPRNRPLNERPASLSQPAFDQANANLRRRAGSACSPAAAHVVNHDAAILDDLNAGTGQAFGGLFVADAELEPHGARRFREDVFDVRVNVFAAPEDVDEINLLLDVGQPPVNFLPENLCDLRVVNRHGDDFKAGALKVLRHVEGRLARLPLGLDSEHGDAFCLAQQFSDLLAAVEKVLLPVRHGSLSEATPAEEWRAAALNCRALCVLL